MTTELEEAKARLTVLVDARLHPPHPTMNPIREDSTITVRLADLRTLLSAVDFRRILQDALTVEDEMERRANLPKEGK